MSSEYPFSDRHGFSLPQASTDTDARVEVSPGLNTLSIPPHVQNVLGSAVGVLQFPVVFAGQRSRTAAGAAFCVHKRELCQTMRRIFADNESLEAGARRLVGHDRVLTDLQAGYGAVTRAGLHAFLTWLAEDEAYIDWYVNSYVNNDTFAEEAAIRDAIEALGNGASLGNSVATLAADFRSLLDHYGLGVFETIIDVALDPPLAIDDVAHPLEDTLTGDHQSDAPGVSRVLSTDDLETRARRVVDVVADMDSEIGSDRALTDVHTDVRRVIGDPADAGLAPVTAADNWSTQPAVTDLPLLAEPHHARPDAQTAHDSQATIGYPTGQAWLFTQAYEATGFGAILYQRRGGDPNWLVNPYVAGDDIHGGESYAAIWEHAFVTDRFAAQLFERASPHHDTVNRVRCPLCALSTDTCADDGCAFAETVTAVDRRADAVVDALESVQD